MGHELHKDQHPPTSLQHKHSSQFIDQHITAASDVKIIFTTAKTFLCVSASHGFWSGQPWRLWRRRRSPGGRGQEDDAPLPHLQQGVPKQIQYQGESSELEKKMSCINKVCFCSRFTYEHTQERSLSAVSTAARRSDRRLTFSSTCPYTSESPGTNV